LAEVRFVPLADVVEFSLPAIAVHRFGYAVQHFGWEFFAKPKGKKTKTAIFHPPKSGRPYLVVTVSPDDVNATAV
jgi:hypothetical protein